MLNYSQVRFTSVFLTPSLGERGINTFKRLFTPCQNIYIRQNRMTHSLKVPISTDFVRF